jgi:hypothetical protein
VLLAKDQLGAPFPCNWFFFPAAVLLLLFSFPLCAQDVRPVIRYANLLGGSDSETPVGVTTDAAGYLYVTGQTNSADFPTTKRLSPSHAPSTPDLFVAKIDPSGGSLIYSFLIGSAAPAAIAVDGAGAVYVAGLDSGADFPTTSGAISTTGRCFLFKVDPSGSSLAYSTKLGCTGYTTIDPRALAVDAAGNVYLAGFCSGMIPTTSGAFRTSGFGSFAMKVNPQGSALVYST